MDNVKRHFETEAAEFDRIIVTLVPDYAEMVEALVSAIPFDSSAPIHVLDLGCGTGTLTLAILNAFPEAQLTCLDLAENMIAMAQTKLARYQQSRYTVADFGSKDFGSGHDLIVSSLALHHMVTDDDKRNLYRRIYAALNLGGAFYNADLVMGSSEFLQAMYMRQWRTFMRQSITDEEIDTVWLPKYETEDHPARLTDHLAWLTETGFCDVDVIWKRYNYAVYGGVKG